MADETTRLIFEVLTRIRDESSEGLRAFAKAGLEAKGGVEGLGKEAERTGAHFKTMAREVKQLAAPLLLELNPALATAFFHMSNVSRFAADFKSGGAVALATGFGAAAAATALYVQGLSNAAEQQARLQIAVRNFDTSALRSQLNESIMELQRLRERSKSTILGLVDDWMEGFRMMTFQKQPWEIAEEQRRALQQQIRQFDLPAQAQDAERAAAEFKRARAQFQMELTSDAAQATKLNEEVIASIQKRADAEEAAALLRGERNTRNALDQGGESAALAQAEARAEVDAINRNAKLQVDQANEALKGKLAALSSFHLGLLRQRQADDEAIMLQYGQDARRLTDVKRELEQQLIPTEALRPFLSEQDQTIADKLAGNYTLNPSEEVLVRRSIQLLKQWREAMAAEHEAQEELRDEIAQSQVSARGEITGMFLRGVSELERDARRRQADIDENLKRVQTAQRGGDVTSQDAFAAQMQARREQLQEQTRLVREYEAELARSRAVGIDLSVSQINDLQDKINAAKRSVRELARDLATDESLNRKLRDPFEGFLEGFRQVGDEADQWGARLTQAVRQTATDMSQAMQDGFFAVLDGKWDDAAAASSRFGRAIVGNVLKALTDELTAATFGDIFRGLRGYATNAAGGVVLTAGVLGAAVPGAAGVVTPVSVPQFGVSATSPGSAIVSAGQISTSVIQQAAANVSAAPGTFARTPNGSLVFLGEGMPAQIVPNARPSMNLPLISPAQLGLGDKIRDFMSTPLTGPGGLLADFFGGGGSASALSAASATAAADAEILAGSFEIGLLGEAASIENLLGATGAVSQEALALASQGVAAGAGGTAGVAGGANTAQAAANAGLTIGGALTVVGGLVGLGFTVYSALQQPPTATNILTSAASGALAGAAIGSAIPAVGTVVGAVVGALIGGGAAAASKAEDPSAKAARRAERQRTAVGIFNEMLDAIRVAADIPEMLNAVIPSTVPAAAYAGGPPGSGGPNEGGGGSGADAGEGGAPGNSTAGADASAGTGPGGQGGGGDAW